MEDEADVQPFPFVTVNVYVPAGRLVIVVLVPVPVVVTPPGLLVNVHVTMDGRPLKITLPVAVSQVGCVIVPTTGADGTGGGEGISTLSDGTDTQPASFVIV